MYTLYLHHINPFCRAVLLMLLEMKIPFQFKQCPQWNHDPDLVALKHYGQIPCLYKNQTHIFTTFSAITEYLNETYTHKNILGNSPLQKSFTRYLCTWANEILFQNVSFPILQNYFFPYLFQTTHSITRQHIVDHQQKLHEALLYLCDLEKHHTWLTGEKISLADLTIAAHLSYLDYLDMIPWINYPHLTQWYLRMKYRPSFQEILKIKFPNITPQKNYPLVHTL